MPGCGDNMGCFCSSRGNELDSGKCRPSLHTVGFLPQNTPHSLPSIYVAYNPLSLGINLQVLHVPTVKRFSPLALFGVSVKFAGGKGGGNTAKPRSRGNWTKPNVRPRSHIHISTMVLASRCMSTSVILRCHSKVSSVTCPFIKCASVCIPFMSRIKLHWMLI